MSLHFFTFPLSKENISEREMLHVRICGLLPQPKWITSLSLNKASLLLFTMNKGCEMCAKTYLHIHANTLVHNNLFGMKQHFDSVAHVWNLYFCYYHEVMMAVDNSNKFDILYEDKEEEIQSRKQNS